MDFVYLSDSLSNLLKKFETLDNDQREIPFVAQIICELKEKYICLPSPPPWNQLSAHQREVIREVVVDDPYFWFRDKEQLERLMAKLDKPHDHNKGVIRKMVNDAALLLRRPWDIIAKKLWKTRDASSDDIETKWGHLRGRCRRIYLQEELERNGGLISCFIYCALYPKGHRIVREDLVNQWMAEGFLQTEVGEELEDVGDRYFHEMLSGCVFEDPLFAFGGDFSDREAIVYSCVMHPLAHEAARCLARVDHDVVVLDGNAPPPYDLTTHIFHRRFVSFHNFGRDSEEYTSRARTCFYFGSNLVINMRLKEANLQVLHVQGLGEGLQLKFLFPDKDNNKYVHQLRYLNVSECEANLYNVLHFIRFNMLQTLALDHSIEMGVLLFASGVMRDMRHLYLRAEEKTLKKMPDMPLLRTLELSECKNLMTLPETIGEFTCLRALRIFNCTQLRYIPGHFLHLKELVIHGCPRLNLTTSRVIDELPSLRYLEIIGVQRLVTLPTGLQSATSLQYLMISECKKLRNIAAVLEHLTSLHKLRLYKCPKLEKIPCSLNSLQSLHIQDCPLLTDRYKTNSHDWAGISHIPDLCIDQQRTHKQEMPSWSTDNCNIAEASSSRADYFPKSVPYFLLKSQSRYKAESSRAMSQKEYDVQDYSHWHVIGILLKAVFRMRAMLEKTIQLREVERQKLLKEQEELEHHRKELEHQRKQLELQQNEMILRVSLFPYDYEFERDTIIQLWMAGGLLRTASSIGGSGVTSIKEHMEDVGARYFHQFEEEGFFKSSNVDILSGKQLYVLNQDKVKEFLNQMSIIEAKDLYSKLESSEKESLDGSFNFKSWHLSLVCNNKINQTTFDALKKFSELKTLLFLGNYGPSLTKVPSEFLLAFRKLESLDLSGSHISEIPSSIEYVKGLHYLNLSFTLIKELPESLGCLQNLQTLKLKGCKQLFNLPDCTKNLISLRHLDFDVVGQLSCMPNGLGALTDLQTLSAFIVGREKGRDIGELAKLNYLTGSFCISGLENVSGRARNALLSFKRRLLELELRWNGFIPNTSTNQDENIPSSIIGDLEPHTYLEKVQIICFPGLYLPNWIGDEKFNRIVRIRLVNCENVELDVTLGNLPSLQHFDITEMNNVKTIDDRIRGVSRGVAFRKLKELIIDGMHSLTMWSVVRNDDFPVLSSLILRSCPKLVEFPFLSLPSLEQLEISDCSTLKTLPDSKLSTSLKSVVIEDCDLLKERCSTGGQDWDKIKHAEIISIDLKNMHSTEVSESDLDSEYEDQDQEE